MAAFMCARSRRQASQSAGRTGSSPAVAASNSATTVSCTALRSASALAASRMRFASATTGCTVTACTPAGLPVAEMSISPVRERPCRPARSPRRSAPLS